MRQHVSRLSIVAGMLALATACSDTSTSPVADPVASTDAASSLDKAAGTGATVAWNQTARDLIVARAVGAPAAQSRILTYLSLAQYNAVVTAEATWFHRGGRASPSVAAGGASVVVLKNFFPLDAALIDAQFAAQLAAIPSDDEKDDHHGGRGGDGWRGGLDHDRDGHFQEDAAAGEAIGRAVGADVLAYAATDNFNVLIPPPAPGGLAEGYWVSSAPLVRGLYGVRPLFLTSADQFRPGPPPAFGSPDYLTALAEIRTISDTRTADQIAEAQYWATKGPAFMNEVAAGMIVAHGRREHDAAHILALANMAGFDAGIGCFDAKFAYWFIRPTMADPLITLAIPLPNHPSYISGHSCNTASYATVLERAFPSEKDLLESYVTRAGLSRMYGGLHYRFDITAGQQLGRDVGNWALRHDVHGDRPFPLD